MRYNPNKRTLDAYNKEMLSFIKNTPQRHQSHHAPLLRWIDTTLSLLPPDARILEIGSGAGREAKYMHANGFEIICSDGAKSFVQYLQSKGETCLWLDILCDEIPTGFNLIFANAVIPHFTEQQVTKILIKIRDSLQMGALFAFSVKEGNGKGWVNEKIETKRYVNYWKLDRLQHLVKNMGWKIVFIENGIKGDLPTHTWANLTIKKI